MTAVQPADIMYKWDKACIIYSQTALPWTTLMPPFPTFNTSPRYLPSPVSSHFPSTSPGAPRGAGGGKSPLLFCRVAKHRSIFYSSPLQTIYQRSTGAQCGHALLPEYHTKILVAIRGKPNFNVAHRKSKWSILTTAHFQCLFLKQNISKDNSHSCPNIHKVHDDSDSKYPLSGIPFLSIIYSHSSPLTELKKDNSAL